MENIHFAVDADKFDSLVHAPNALPELGDVSLIAKKEATASGRPGVVISFSVRLPDGTFGTAQAVVTWRLLKNAVIGLEIMLDR